MNSTNSEKLTGYRFELNKRTFDHLQKMNQEYVKSGLENTIFYLTVRINEQLVDDEIIFIKED